MGEDQKSAISDWQYGDQINGPVAWWTEDRDNRQFCGTVLNSSLHKYIWAKFCVLFSSASESECQFTETPVLPGLGNLDNTVHHKLKVNRKKPLWHACSYSQNENWAFFLTQFQDLLDLTVCGSYLLWVGYTHRGPGSWHRVIMETAVWNESNS